MAITLYQFAGGEGLSSVSAPCLKIDLALRRCKVEYRVKNLTPIGAKQVSPTGKLPLLELDGDRIVDSIRILDELERRFPRAGLVPDEAPARLTDRLWEAFVNDHMYWYGYYTRWIDAESSPRFIDAMIGKLPLPVRAAARLAVVAPMRKRAMMHGVGGMSRDDVHAATCRALDMLVEGLAGGPFLQGRSTPGRGDLAMASTLVQVGYRDAMPRVRAEVEGRPALLAHLHATYAACDAKLPRWLAAN